VKTGLTALRLTDREREILALIARVLAVVTLLRG
jgi:hypothetical protein